MKEFIRDKLAETSKSYLTNGLKIFHSVRRLNVNFQVSLGNISISIELCLKALIAEKCFSFLFKNLPLDLNIKLSYPEIEKRNPIPKLTLNEIESFTFNTQEFDTCISIFYTLFPEKKQEFKPYFRYLSNVRNTVVHGVIPLYKKYELEKIAYFSIELIKFLQSENISIFKLFKFTKEDESFYSNYDNLRTIRVEKAINEANQKVNNTEHSLFLYGPEDWDLYTTTCPICQSDAILYGYSDFSIEPTEFGDKMYLQFLADSFNCNECGLELLDKEELRLAGMETVYDREYEDIDKFMHDNLSKIDPI